MQTKLGRRIALGAALALAAVCSGPAGAQTAPKTTLADVTGPDDGYAISIEATGDFAGNFEPCGCKVPLGGLARRAGYAKAIEEQTGGKAAVVQVDAGRIFAGEYGPGYAKVDDLKTKNEWVLRAIEALDLRAANVSAYDLGFVGPMMVANGFDARVATFPALDRLVSANAVPTSSKVRPFKPYVVVEVAAERLGAKPLRVGFLGVTEIPSAGATVGDYKIGDPLAALRKYAPELRAKCDVMVVLAYMAKESLGGVESSAPGVDVIVAAHQIPALTYDGPVEFPATVFGPNLGRGLGELRLYAAPAGQSTRIAKATVRYVSITPLIPDEAAALALTRDAVKAFRRTQ